MTEFSCVVFLDETMKLGGLASVTLDWIVLGQFLKP